MATLRPNFSTRGSKLALPAAHASSSARKSVVQSMLVAAGTTLSGLAVWHLVLPFHPGVGAWAGIVAGAIGALTCSAAALAGAGGVRAKESQTAEALERMSSQLAEGRAVCWAGPVYLLPKGIQSNGRVYPWAQIDAARSAREHGQLLIFLRGRSEPVAAINLSGKNFEAGLTLFEQKVASAALASPVTPPREPSQRLAA